MLLKLGVDISRLEFHCRKSLVDVGFVYFNVANEETIITSTYEGNHSPGSLHYQNRAFDVRLPKTKVNEVTTELKKHLSKDFDIVLERDHIHIEYDPK
jgi:hypothetical protein